MRKEVMYKFIATDGEEFESEEECMEHENAILSYRDWRFFNADGDLIDPYDVDTALFIEIPNYIKKKEFDAVIEYFNVNYRAFCGIAHPGRWFYDTVDDVWRCLETEQATLDEILNVFQMG